MCLTWKRHHMDVLGSSDLNLFSYLPLRNLQVLDLRFSFSACLVDFFFSRCCGLDIISGKYINYQMISLTVLVCLVFSGCIWIIGLTFCCSQYIASSLLLCLHLSFSFKIKYRHDLKIQFCKMLGTMLARSLSCGPHKRKPDGVPQDKNVLFLFIVKDWRMRWRFASCFVFLGVWEHTYSPMAFYMTVDCLTGYAVMKESVAEPVMCILAGIDLGTVTGFSLFILLC